MPPPVRRRQPTQLERIAYGRLGDATRAVQHGCEWILHTMLCARRQLAELRAIESVHAMRAELLERAEASEQLVANINYELDGLRHAARGRSDDLAKRAYVRKRRRVIKVQQHIDNLLSIVDKLDDAIVNRTTLRAMTGGLDALRGIIGQLDIDNIDETHSQLQELFDDHEDAATALAAEVRTAAYDDEDIEREWRLLVEGDAPTTGGAPPDADGDAMRAAPPVPTGLLPASAAASSSSAVVAQDARHSGAAQRVESEQRRAAVREPLLA